MGRMPLIKQLKTVQKNRSTSAITPITAQADAPPPVDYVRVCDAYGNGFFYIPGTETCLRFNGYVRSTYSSVSVGDDNYTFWGQRARLNVDTRTETDSWTLRALYRLEAGDSNEDENVDMDVALISVGGFRAGFAGANYWSSNHGFGWVNSESVAGNADGVFDPAGFYGFDDATLFDYTWVANGFSATIGVEDPRISHGWGAFGNATNDGASDSYVNFYAGFNYQGDGYGVAATAVFDSLGRKTTGGTVDDGEWAWKVSADLDLSEFVPGGSLWAVYMSDGDYDTDYVHTNLLTENPSSIWGVAFQMDLADEVEFWVNYWDADGTDDPAPGISTTGDVQQFGAGINWFPKVAPGFSIKTTYFAGEIQLDGTALPLLGNTNDTDYDGFEVTIRRNF